MRFVWFNRCGERYAVKTMRTLLSDPLPEEVEALLERRRQWGADLHDEVWEGVLHVVPAPDFRHAAVSAQVASLLRRPASAKGLTVTDAFNLGNSQDFRVPHAGLHRPGANGTWLPSAALVVEVLSPDDDTWQKLPFYAAHDVDELLIVDPQTRAVDWLGLAQDGYQPIEHSRVIDLGAAALARQIEWV
jgi:Uma2 family endonuclease